MRQLMSNEEVREAVRRLLDGHPDGYDLPLLHKAQATLVRVERAHAVVRRDSGSTARIPLRLIRMRLTEMASGERLLVSELRDRPNDRFNSALGPLMAALPGVALDPDDKRLYYDSGAT